MSYSAEQTGHIVAWYSYTRERLAKRLDKLAVSIDLDTACRGLERITKARIAKLIRDAHELPRDPKTGKYADVAGLLAEVERLRAIGERGNANHLSAVIRTIRTLTMLAGRMSRSMKLQPAPARGAHEITTKQHP